LNVFVNKRSNAIRTALTRQVCQTVAACTRYGSHDYRRTN